MGNISLLTNLQEKLGSIITKWLVTGVKPSIKNLSQRDAQFYDFLESLSV